MSNEEIHAYFDAHSNHDPEAILQIAEVIVATGVRMVSLGDGDCRNTNLKDLAASVIASEFISQSIANAYKSLGFAQDGE